MYLDGFSISCRILSVYFIYFVSMHTIHTILDLNVIFFFEFALKRTLTSFCIFFLFVKTHIINLIYIVRIKFQNKSSCVLQLHHFISWYISGWSHQLLAEQYYSCLPVLENNLSSRLIPAVFSRAYLEYL